MAFLLADHQGFLAKAWRTRSMFSGVLSEGSLPGGFLCVSDTVSLKFLTHNSTVLQLGTLLFRWILKCQRNIRWVITTESLFLKYVSTVKARCSTDQRSMATEMLWVLIEGRSKSNSPRQQFHSRLCCQIVRYSARPHICYYRVSVHKRPICVICRKYGSKLIGIPRQVTRFCGILVHS